MTEQQHPITPPQELINKWRAEGYDLTRRPDQLFPNLRQTSDYLYHKIAEWGWQQRDATVPQERQEAADQELEVCYEWVKEISGEFTANCLRDARRPKYPSLEEIQFIESYLAHKYGFAEELPADHPYKSFCSQGPIHKEPKERQ